MMDATEQARRSDALYYSGNDGINRRWLCDKVASLEAENANLRELLAEDNEELAKMRRAIDYLYSFAKTCGVDAEDMRELGVEVEA